MEANAILKYLERNSLSRFSPKAVLSDMDGVLFNSMPLHTMAWYRMATELGIECTRDEFYFYEGMTGAQTINRLFERAFNRSVSREQAAEYYKIKARYFRELGDPDVMPGAREAMTAFRQNGIECVLVTGSGQQNVIERIDREFNGIFDANHRITAANVTHGKPHPEPYLKAMTLVNRDAHQCIVLENAPMGVMAGHASGAFVVAVATGPIPRQDLMDAGADIVYASMNELFEHIPALLLACQNTTLSLSQNLHFTSDVSATLSQIMSAKGCSSVFVITDENVQRHVLPRLAQNPHIASAKTIVVKPGDDHKNLDSLSHIWGELSKNGTRKSLVINIGGGVVTDMGGFAASAFKRGIPFINIPTSLLGAVDAAVGGKTGINFGGLKNEIGAFCEATDVIISTQFFNTLPTTELKSGFAEMLKHALLHSEAETNALLDFDILNADPHHLLALLRKSVNIKAQIVRQDPHESGLRRALNLGHTVGHALESHALTSTPIPHGYAVAWGFVAELVLAHIKLGFPSNYVHRIADFVLENYGAHHITCNDYPALLALMRHDKKSAAGEINCSLLSAPGQIALNQIISESEILEALDLYRDLMRI